MDGATDSGQYRRCTCDNRCRRPSARNLSLANNQRATDQNSISVLHAAGHAWKSAPTTDIAEQIKQQMGDNWLPYIYAQRVLRLRTRSYTFTKPQPTARITVQHTLLGIELKIGRQ